MDTVFRSDKLTAWTLAVSTNVFTSQVEKHRKQIRLKLKKLSGISNKSFIQ